MNTLSRHKSPLALPFSKPHCRISLKNHLQRGKAKTLRKRMKRLRSEMDEISVEQGKIREGQRQVREKYEAVEMECELLRRPTHFRSPRADSHGESAENMKISDNKTRLNNGVVTGEFIVLLLLWFHE
ncbi:hypothetical protein V6N12_015129 [Hibiscus sabdariffa]|uniref:Uncharacterized protein n=1 Tax=Hibiscus sabdariffa TaxID=183260 RepID=A0ABR2DM81_9ROSI